MMLLRRTLNRGVAHALLLTIVALTAGIGALLPAVAVAEMQEPAPAPSSSPDPGSTVPADIQLQAGQTATLEGGALQVTFVDVIEDSRCPMDVMCVWMGQAVVSLHVVLDGVDRGEVVVTLYPGPQARGPRYHDATVDRYVLSLADLQPYPRAGQPQPLDQRVATIRVAPATP
jgi:hypothetical protein